MIFITYNSPDLISKILFSTTYKGIGYINKYTRANTVIVWVARGIPSNLHVEHTGDLRKPTNLMGLAITVNLLHLDIRRHTNTHSCLPCCVELYGQPVFSCIRSVWPSQRQINDQTSATSLPWHTNKTVECQHNDCGHYKNNHRCQLHYVMLYFSSRPNRSHLSLPKTRIR